MSERAPDEVVESVSRAFERRFGDAPTGVWSAPGRVNLIGEHTDYNGGLCLPIALPHRTYVALRRRDDDRVRLVSAQESTATSNPPTVRPASRIAQATPTA